MNSINQASDQLHTQMNETIATATTHPVDLEAVRLQLKEDGRFYSDYRNQNPKEARERLLHTLQSNDCREIIATVVNEDDLVSAFAGAAYKGHVDVLEAFLHHGMNIDSKDKDGWTALMHASYIGQEDCVRFLLDHNASVNIQDNYEMTALTLASQDSNIKIVEMLLEKNANPDIQNNNGMTALMFACSYDSKEIVQFLLNHNADIELKNDDGKTVLDLTNDDDIKELLLNHVTSNFVLK
jgi:ankyrin repeat protein